VFAVGAHRPGWRALAAGITWTSRTIKAEWAGRSYHTTVIDAAGAIYVIGGYRGGTTYYRDVWVSTDGGERTELGIARELAPTGRVRARGPQV
jgi:hypothetical protein